MNVSELEILEKMTKSATEKRDKAPRKEAHDYWDGYFNGLVDLKKKIVPQPATPGIKTPVN